MTQTDNSTETQDSTDDEEEKDLEQIVHTDMTGYTEVESTQTQGEEN